MNNSHEWELLNTNPAVSNTPKCSAKHSFFFGEYNIDGAFTIPSPGFRRTIIGCTRSRGLHTVHAETPPDTAPAPILTASHSRTPSHTEPSHPQPSPKLPCALVCLLSPPHERPWSSLEQVILHESFFWDNTSLVAPKTPSVTCIVCTPCMIDQTCFYFLSLPVAPPLRSPPWSPYPLLGALLRGLQTRPAVQLQPSYNPPKHQHPIPLSHHLPQDNRITATQKNRRW